MKRAGMIRQMIIILVIMAFLFSFQGVFAEGNADIVMPSLGEALLRYPTSETENADGSVSELYTHVSEEDYDVFSSYLAAKGAEPGDYSVEHGVLTAEIRANGASFSIIYDSGNDEVKVTYPSGTCDEWIKKSGELFSAAQKLLGEGNTEEVAGKIFRIPQYRDYAPLKEMLQNNAELAAAVTSYEERLVQYRTAGNKLTFGRYEQDRSTRNGPEEIEWITLAYDEKTDRVLLTSRYGLDAMAYNATENVGTTWETCSLRSWLNGEFLQTVFTAEEQAAIPSAEVDNSPAQGSAEWNTDGGNSTQDRIFLLSCAEAERYLTADTASISATSYASYRGGSKAAKAMKAKTAEGKQAVWWWLRSPGSTQSSVMTVMNDGTFGSFEANLDYGVIRPAFWLDLKKVVFGDSWELSFTYEIQEEGILPVRTEVTGIGMPSPAEALAGYPDSETENEDGSVTELYKGFSEADYDTFSAYLGAHGAETGEYQVKDGVLTAEIQVSGASFSFIYDSKRDEAKAIYPAGSFDDWTRKTRKRLVSVQAILEDGETGKAVEEFFQIPLFRNYAPAVQFLRDHPEFEAAVVSQEEQVTAFRTPGSRIAFGKYEQDIKAKGQTQPIEWLVLDYDADKGKALLLSRYSLDSIQYDEAERTDATWETCTLRGWLNNAFLNTAFTPEEQAAILTTEVDNGPSQAYPGCIADGGNNTQDRLFLLSYAEANDYLEANGNVEARASATSVAAKKGSNIAALGVGRNAEDEKTYFWGLRSPGEKQGSISSVNQDGYVHTWMGSGWNVFVRPAVWVDVKAATGAVFAHAYQGDPSEGILPSRTEIVPVAMPSLTEVLQRYPDSETKNEDGSSTFLYKRFMEKEYNAFSVYLEQQGAKLEDDQIQGGILTANVLANGISFNVKIDSDSGEIEITYPDGTCDPWVREAKKLTNFAQDLLQEGKTDEALAKIISISQYRNYTPVKKLLRDNTDLEAALKARDERLTPYRTVGDRVFFGRYEQDNDPSNGKEAIEWIVLDYDEKEDKALLLSRYCLAAMGHEEPEKEEVRWNSSEIRNWLNEKFMRNAFTAGEQNAILTTEVDNGPSQGCQMYIADGGENTMDQIFLLSYTEAQKYLDADVNSDNFKPRAAGTTYAVKNDPGNYNQRWHGSDKTVDGERTVAWWLRSPGRTLGNVAFVSAFGKVDEIERYTGEFMVRPAFWLDLNTDIF